MTCSWWRGGHTWGCYGEAERFIVGIHQTAAGPREEYNWRQRRNCTICGMVEHIIVTTRLV